MNLLTELPYYGYNIVITHGQFNNLLVDQFINGKSLPTKKNLDKLHSLYDLDLFNLNSGLNYDNSHNHNIISNYYSPHSFLKTKNRLLKSDNSFSILHNNIRSLKKNLENFESHVLDEIDYQFDIIGISETKITNNALPINLNLNIPNYCLEYVPTPLSCGGVGMYINKRLIYSVLERTSNENFQALWIEIHQSNKKNIICGILYRQHSCPKSFLDYLEKALDFYSSKNKSLFILGDFNIDLLKSETCQYSHDFFLLLQSCYLFPTIDKPTRVYNNSATLIDNICANHLNYNIISGNIVSDISDHFLQFCIIPEMKSHNNNLCNKIRIFSKDADSMFVEELMNSELGNVCSKTLNIDQNFSAFFRSVNKAVNKVAPIRHLSKRKLKSFSKPWITSGIRQSINIKNRLFVRGEHAKYIYYRNKLTTLIRASKSQYYADVFEANKSNSKKTWAIINSLLHSKKSKSGRKPISALQDPALFGEICSDKAKLPNIMNNFFASIGNNLANKITTSTTSHFADYMTNIDQPNSFFYKPATSEEIENEILLLSNHKTYGLYSIPITLLKSARSVIGIHLANLINLSVQTGQYPSKLKIAKVIPIFKDEDDTDPSNYRPISLLSVFNRIFEKVMYNRLIEFIDKHGILSNAQYGFRKCHSTHHAVLDIINQIHSNIDNKLYTCAIFLDLKKAFDTVNHDILLKKLYLYGVRGCGHDWFASYLSNRMQTTAIDSFISNKLTVNCGVPQGSVLGPLLFLLYINDITSSSTLLKFHLFADDTNILYSNKCHKTLERVVNQELRKVQEWLFANKLTLNIKKSNFVIFQPHRRIQTHPISIKLYDPSTKTCVPLECKDFVKYLGVLFDMRLSWKNHIDDLCNRISRTVGVISKLRHFLPRYVLLKIYKSLLHPLLSYGVNIWGQANKTAINKVLILQKRALRLIFFKKSNESAIPLFKENNILPVTFLYYHSLAQLMFDVSTNKAPRNIRNMFVEIKDVHSYNTRSNTVGNFFCKFSRIELQKRSFSRAGVKLWNKIPLRLKNLSRTNFKKEFQQLLLYNLTTNGYHVEISRLSLK